MIKKSLSIEKVDIQESRNGKNLIPPLYFLRLSLFFKSPFHIKLRTTKFYSTAFYTFVLLGPLSKQHLQVFHFDRLETREAWQKVFVLGYQQGFIRWKRPFMSYEIRMIFFFEMITFS